MTIRKGEAWGTTGPAPEGLVRVHGDAALGRLVIQHRERQESLPPVALLGGDLMRAVGGTGSEERLRGDVAILPVDVVRAEAAGSTAWFVAHLVARRSWWRGPIVGAMNTQYLDEWDVSPRAHPNDGRVDVVRVAPTMSVRDRWRARGRLVHGTHVPHPAIEIRQTDATTIDLGRPTPLVLDGTPWVTADTVVLTVEPDALVVVI